MAHTLQGKKVAILVADGFEQVELTEPRQALQQAGAEARVVSPAKGKVKGWNHTEWGEEIPADVSLDQADAGQYDALLLPGGVMNPDKLRRNATALAFVKAFFDAQKPVAVICHGPWTLIDAGVVRGRRITSYPSIQTDLKNAGAQWVDEEVVLDQGLVSSRKPDDIPAFNQKMVEEFAESRHQKRAVAWSTDERSNNMLKADGSMAKVALWVRLEAKPGKESDVENFLLSGLLIVQDEPATTTWYAIKLGPSTFGIFDTFPDDSGRQAHLSGKVAAALKEKAAELFARPPSIEKIDILAAKLTR